MFETFQHICIFYFQGTLEVEYANVLNADYLISQMFIQKVELFFIPQGRQDPEIGFNMFMNRNILPLF